ncbi:ribosome maturation factor RimM [Xylella fastidiosa subsp. morus]|jgi:16S rRNA processing protein RimM|uniref:Ribosome maturation factor RimM n=3 Tax=Xylella fastidiosa TaxID=2371 RepID=RIMM_XYLFT|nr:ribosome maturation factor RimM [Xylella fastidiosa]B2I6A7.1 RecName: Full=Ribosome maturation factor RimM [Xylella fastidiosa M23]Q87F55.1 RecName: Full=Ribosome maturation factor RimM [Xylella fastidiosa Temecula1]ADN63073.1 16S rRNA-processing protein RimM [Xylella fastidiosa subsp. fastidiosa GB514]KAF0570442.1 16S rRNA-processing protein RimM [Xylella fastidiosa subsp. fastidiosa Mus-1]AAO27982.1 16S rRNA processing protein [Xylella fastidiosa Temecula1]ACB91531.1 16S rRNA processing 
MKDNERRILLGRVVGGFGLRGEIKIESWTEPRDAIFRYQPWLLRSPTGTESMLNGARGYETGKRLIATFPGINDRNGVEAICGTEIYVPRSALPPPHPDEYYWVDLEGLQVHTLEGVVLGSVSHLFSNGANDVIVIHGERERLIPFVQPDYVKSVDFEAERIVVDWDPEF